MRLSRRQLMRDMSICVGGILTGCGGIRENVREPDGSLNGRTSMMPLSGSFIHVGDAGLRPGDPKYDNTPKFNKLMEMISSRRTIYFGAGAYYFNSPPKIIEQSVVMIGDHTNSTSLIRNYNATGPDEALIHTRRTLVMERLPVLAGEGTSHGGAIRLEGLSASASVLRDLYITTAGQKGGTFDIPLTLYSTHELGIRGCLIDNVELFAATVHIAWFVNVKGLTARLNGYPAGGTVDHITIQGYDSTKRRSEAIQFETRHLVRLYVYTTNNLILKDLCTDDGGFSTQVIRDKESTNIVRTKTEVIPIQQ